MEMQWIDNDFNSKKKKKKMDKIAEGAAVFGGAQLIQPAIRKLFDEFKGMLVYTLVLDTYHESVDRFISEYFKNIPEAIELQTSEKFNSIEVKIKSMSSVYVDKDGDYYDYGMVDGIPAKIHIHYEVQGSSRGKYIEISTLRIKDYPKKLKSFIKKYITNVDAEIAASGRKCIEIVNPYEGHIYELDSTIRRDFNNVFIPDNIVNEICESLDKFRNSKDWYEEHNIPCHFGIMLYGAAGMGKSSIAQAIATYMHSNLFVLSGDCVMALPKAIRMINQNTTRHRNEYNIILIEDVDCGIAADNISNRLSKMMSTHKSIDDDMLADNHMGLASVLNILDGIGAPNNVIFIFTTNHIEKLDPALIRPGRIDLSLEIKPVCLESFGKFMVHHYGDTVYIPKNLSIRDNLSFAELQTLVMKGYTSDKLIEFVKKKTKKSSSTPTKFGEIEPEEFAKLKKGKE